MESYKQLSNGELELLQRKILDLSQPDQAASAMKAALEDPAVKEIRTRKIEVGEEVQVGGKTLRLTDAGWRRVDTFEPTKTHELTPMERRLVSD